MTWVASTAKSYGNHRYYRCAAWMRAEPCDGSRAQIREDALAPQLDTYLSALTMPPRWQDRVREMLDKQSQSDELVKRREALRGQLRRLNYQYEQGLIEEADVPEYQKKAQKLIREINSIVISDPNQTIDICTHALGFASTWHKADQHARHAILKEIFDAIYVDTHTKQIVGVKPYIEFVPMFRQTQLIETEGRFVLKNDKTALEGRPDVWNGRDGIRIFARREVGYRPKPSAFIELSTGHWYSPDCTERNILAVSEASQPYRVAALPMLGELCQQCQFAVRYYTDDERNQHRGW